MAEKANSKSNNDSHSQTPAKAESANRSARLSTSTMISGVSRQAIIDHLSKADKKMATLIEKVGPLTIAIDGMQSSYQSLAESIVYQQIHGKAARSICQKIWSKYESGDVFPEPQIMLAASIEDLRACGLSGAKAAAIQDLAEKTLEGVVPTVEDMAEVSDEELIQRLSSVRGIGPWTVQMMLIFRLGRLDIMPSTDFGIRKGFALTYFSKAQLKVAPKAMPAPLAITKHAEKWRPYRSAAAWYLWRACELDR